MRVHDFKKVFITGCDTDAGKTIVSAILAQALEADYWKPIQCGSLDDSDTLTVSRLVTNQQSEFHPEAYLFEDPISPHAAAAREGLEIEMKQIELPETDKFLIIEGAGGALVPINRTHTMADLILHFEAPAIVVSRHYLGSINHTLMTLETLKQRDIPILGVIFVGDPEPESETAIVNIGNVKMLGRIAWEDTISPGVIAQYARLLREVL